MQFSKSLIGFSTGAIARGDWRFGLKEICRAQLRAIELSALRYHELKPLVSEIDEFDASAFEYDSVHLPSKYPEEREKTVLELVERLAARDWPMILHPDTIVDWSAWQQFGRLICVENMDKRKHIGRTAEGLAIIFDRLPEATLCFDFGHARQVDRTMTEGARILRAFSNRLQQFHFSDVDTTNHHRTLNEPALDSFDRLKQFIRPDIPVILETPVYDGGIEEQLGLAQGFFARVAEPVFA